MALRSIFFFLLGSLGVSTSVISLMAQSPVSGYEWSIYAGLGPTFWYPFWIGLGSTVGGTILAVVRDGRWRYGLSIVGLYMGVLYALPYLHGYYQYGAGLNDIMAHWGYSIMILKTGYIPDSDWYPMLHTQFAIHTRLGLSRRAVMNVAAVLFNVSLVVGSYLFIRERVRSSRIAAVTALATFAPVYILFNRSLHPFMLSMMMLPLLFYAVDRRRVNSSRQSAIWSTLVIVLFSFVLFFHPITTIYAGIWLFVRESSEWLKCAISKPAQKQDRLNEAGKSQILVLLSMFGIGFVGWYLLTFERIKNPIATVIFGIFGQTVNTGEKQVETTNTGEKRIEAATTPDLETTELVVQFVEQYGPPFLFIVLGGSITLVVAWRFMTERRRAGNRVVLTRRQLAIQVLVGGLITLSLLPTGLFNRPTRAAQYGLFATSLLIGVTAGALLVNNTGRTDTLQKSAAIILALSLVLAVPAGTATTYAPNRHMLESESDGAEWVLDSNQDKYMTASIAENVKTVYYHKGLTEEAAQNYSSFNAFYPQRLRSDSSTIGRAYSRDTVMITKVRDRYRYRARHPSQWDTLLAYRSGDLQRLHQDESAEKMYHNGEYGAWIVASRNGGADTGRQSPANDSQFVAPVN